MLFNSLTLGEDYFLPKITIFSPGRISANCYGFKRRYSRDRLWERLRFALHDMAKSGASALGVDWTCSARNARYLSGGQITLQGNFDPSRLLSPIPTIKSEVNKMIDGFGKDRYIVNLGHGILPNIPVDHAQAFVDAVKEYKV